MRKKIGTNIEKITILLFVIYMLNNYFLDGILKFIELPDTAQVIPEIINYGDLLAALVCVCCVQYTKRDVLVVAVGYLLTVVTLLASREAALIVTWTWMVLTKNVSYYKWIRSSMYCNCIGTLAGILATVTGICKNIDTSSRGIFNIRYTLGFGQPNFTGNILFLIAASYCWLKRDELKRKDYCILFLITIVCYVFPNSVGTTIIMMVFAALLLSFQYIFRSVRAETQGLKILFYGAIAIAVLSIILGLIDVSRIPVLSQIDRMTSYRYSDVYRTFEKCGFSLIGQPVDFSELNAYASTHGERNYYMDCMWMYLPVHYGILYSIAFVYVYFSAMYRFVKKRDVKTVILFFCGALYAAEQQIWPSLMTWIFMVFLREKLFQSMPIVSSLDELDEKC